MQDVIVDISESSVIKRSLTERGYTRLLNEYAALERLNESPYVPDIQSYTDKNNQIKITMDYIEGTSLRETLGSSDGYEFTPLPQEKAIKYLSQYVDIEMDLLNRGVIYRDLNLAHVIFNGKSAHIVDLEASILKSENGIWRQNDMRGTWETMAPEEFPINSLLTTRTATYRTAVIAHLLIAGKLPFLRFPDSRAKTYSSRKQHTPRVDPTLPKSVRKVLLASLYIHPSRRHKDPSSFFARLIEASESGVKRIHS